MHKREEYKQYRSKQRLSLYKEALKLSYLLSKSPNFYVITSWLAMPPGFGACQCRVGSGQMASSRSPRADTRLYNAGTGPAGRTESPRTARQQPPGHAWASTPLLLPQHPSFHRQRGISPSSPPCRTATGRAAWAS